MKGHRMKSSATNSTQMKLSNKWLILNIIRKKSVSRADIARLTSLTRAAVTIITDELIKDGTIIEIGAAASEIGRKPILLDLNPDCRYFIGVSLARNHCHVGITNIKGTLLLKREINMDVSWDAGASVKAIGRTIEDSIKAAGIPQDKVVGIGFCAPGPVDINTGMILNPPNFDKWHHFRIVEELKKYIPYNVFLENNSTSLTLMEKNYGNGGDFAGFMLMVVDTGIGAGMIINDQLYRGYGGFGCEVGHASVDINGIRCSCGNRGCLEVYASIPAVLDAMQKQGRDYRSWSEIVDGALTGDELCKTAIEKEAWYLSAGIINILNILDLEAVILTGDINYKPEMLMNSIRDHVGKAVITRNIRNCRILNSKIVKDFEVVAAAAIVIENYFRGET